MIEVLLDAFLDALKIFPIILIVYVLIEFLESREATKHSMAKAFSSRFSPFFGAVIGVVPQCGFSVVATKLYQGGYIYLGTLIAVFFATSDEAIPILFSKAFTDSSAWLKLGLLVGVKFVYAVIAGFVINFIVIKFFKKSAAYASTGFAEESFSNDADGCCHHHISSVRNGITQYLIHPLMHSLKIVIYVFIVNLAFGILIELVIGVEAFESFLNASLAFQPLVCTLVGLIPNCASSVLLAELYASGSLSFGGALAGLTVNSGLALAVLLRDKSNIKRNLVIVAVMFILAIVLGYAFLPF